MAPCTHTSVELNDEFQKIETKFIGIKEIVQTWRGMLTNISNDPKDLKFILLPPQHDPFETDHQETPYEESSKHGETRHHHSSFNNHHQLSTDSSGWNRFPKIEVNKFNGPYPVGWVSQMEHYFSLHNITDDRAKVRVAVLYLDFERWQ